MAQEQTARLIDSAPPESWAPLMQGEACPCAIVHQEWLTKQDPAASLVAALAHSARVIDIAAQPTYIADMRRSIRPLWFPAPDARHIPLAERLLLDTAQNGTLDFPARLHGPIETWIIARLCRTPITPTQITLFTGVISALTTFLFATGNLISGTVLALLVGILDGLDGKQARVKVETTALGKREHLLDYVLELSWWTALASHFHAFVPLVVLVLSDLLDRYAKRLVKEKTGRHLDDLAPFDRFVRLIGGRRNIYIWIFAAGLALGAPGQAFRALCFWGALTAAVHLWRGLWIARA